MFPEYVTEESCLNLFNTKMKREKKMKKSSFFKIVDI